MTAATHLRKLKKSALVVKKDLTVYGLPDRLGKISRDYFSGLFKPAVKIHCCDDRLKAVSERGILFSSARKLLAFAQKQEFAHFELPGCLSKRPFADGNAAHLGKITLISRGVHLVQHAAYYKVTNGISDKLKPLIGFPVSPTLFENISGVCERGLKKRFVLKDISQFVFKFRKIRVHIPPL